MFGKHAPPKKRRKSRTAFTNQQIYELEKRFLYQKYLTPADRDEIAHTLGLSNAQVKKKEEEEEEGTKKEEKKKEKRKKERRRRRSSSSSSSSSRSLVVVIAARS